MYRLMRCGAMILFCALAFLYITEVARAETYQWTDRDGTTHFTDDIAKVPLSQRPKIRNDRTTEPNVTFQDGGYSGIRVYGINIVEQGIYSASPVGAYPANTMSSDVKITTNARLQKRTSEVKAKLGTIFGITYVVNGTPSDGRADITVKVISPPLNDPASNEKSTEQSWVAPKELNQTTHDFYVFEKPWELVPGIWTFSIYYRNKFLDSRSFEVR